MRKQKGFDKSVFLAAIIAMVVIAISCAPGPGGGGGGGEGGDGGDDFGCLPHENPALFYTDKNQNGVPVLTLYTSWAFYECVADGDTIPEYPCFTRNSGPPETSTEIPTAYCGGITTDTDGDGVTDTDDCAPLDNSKWAMTTVRPDGDFDTIPNTDAPQSMCLGNTTPTGWTRTGLPLDNCLTVANPTQTDTDGDGIGDACESDPGNPAVTIPEPLPGDTFYVNEGFPVTVTVAPYIAAIQNVSFNVGGNTTMCPADSTVPYNCTVTPTALGNLTITATAHAANGRTGTASVTVVVISATQPPKDVWSVECPYRYGDGSRNYYQYNGTGCSIFQDSPDPPYQNNAPTICGSIATPCVFKGDLRETILLPGASCELQGYIPSGVNEGFTNPTPSFTTPEGADSDWAITGYDNGSTIIYADNMMQGPVYGIKCNLYFNGTLVGNVPIKRNWTGHGANFKLFITGAQDLYGDTINIFLGTYTDPDGDGFPTSCPVGLSGCQEDNCIAYFNPYQELSSIPNIGAICVGHADPFWNDSDNDGFWDGVDLFPNDPTSF